MATNPQPKPQQGWGIGYGDSNVSGGFNDFYNLQGVQNEINRMNTVMQNRTAQGLGNNAQQNYYNQLQTYMQPYNQQQQIQDQARNDYQNSQARADATNWTNATIDDIAAKYGFNFSRDYAKQQAEAEAQALRNANLDAQRRNVANRDMGKANIDASLMNQAEAMDRNYFQQMLQQQQNQVGTGINAGLAADQDLRLQMARQAEMGAAHRDANLGRMRLDENFSLDDLRLAEAMGLIDQQALAREESLYNDGLMRGYGILDNDRNFYNALDQQMWGRSQAEIDRAMGQQNYLMDHGLRQSQFDWGKYMDQQGLGQWQQQFDYGKERDLIGDDQWRETFDWSKVVDQHGMNMAERQLAAARAAQAQMSQAQQQAYGYSYDQLMNLFKQFQRQQQQPSIPQYQGTLQTSGFRHLYG